MSKTIAICIVVVAVGVWLGLSFAAPWVLSDKNDFLEKFVGPELIAFMGVVVTISLASAANLHIQLNQMEESKGRRGFPNTRRSLRASSYSLIALLAASVALATSKAWIPNNEVSQSLLNGACLLAVLASILVLIQLTSMALMIEADVPDTEGGA